jgi:hypothetical protein
MVAIPVFYGEDKADPDAYLREFKRVCMANGDRDVATWLQFFPDFLEEAAVGMSDNHQVSSIVGKL